MLFRSVANIHHVGVFGNGLDKGVAGKVPSELIAVLYTHKPTGFQFTNYCIRPAGIISSSLRHDLLLYDWAEHQAA